MMHILIPCAKCGVDRPLPEFLRDPPLPRCCEESLAHAADDVMRVANELSIHRMADMVNDWPASMRETVDKFFDTLLTHPAGSTMPQLRQVAGAWRKHRFTRSE